MFSIAVHAQNDVTQFLGIQVDGSKSEMILKLKEKGYYSTPHDSDVLEGEFNGGKVNISIVTNNNKVCRIVVIDAIKCDESSIKIRFNNLCEQFKNNSKYMRWADCTIPEEENISYEMTVRKKRYQATFYQKPDVVDTLGIAEKVRSILLSKYTAEQLANPTEELKSSIMNTSSEYLLEQFSKKSVWFMIVDYQGKYFITMFYDNEYNRANGEDL